MSSSSPPPPLLSEIQETIQLLESTSQQLSGDTLLDLTWLERRVSFLCSQTDSLTPHEAAVSLMIMSNGLLSEWLRSGKAFGLTDLGMRLVRRHLETLRKRPRAG